jgi:hypothetical protein
MVGFRKKDTNTYTTSQNGFLKWNGLVDLLYNIPSLSVCNEKPTEGIHLEVYLLYIDFIYSGD